MAERIDAVAVDVRHSTRSAELQIAADQHHADRVARLQRSFERRLAVLESGGAAAGGDESLLTQCAGEDVGDVGLEARHHERRRDRTQQRPDLLACEPRDGADARQLRVAGPVGEGPVPVQRFAERGREPVARQRVLDFDFRARRSHVAERRRVGHLGDRRDAGDRFL